VNFNLAIQQLAPDVVIAFIGLWDATDGVRYDVYSLAGGLLLPEVEIPVGHVIGFNVQLYDQNVDPGNLVNLYVEIRRNGVLYVDVEGTENTLGFWTPTLDAYDYAITQNTTIEITAGYVTP